MLHILEHQQMIQYTVLVMMKSPIYPVLILNFLLNSIKPVMVVMFVLVRAVSLLFPQLNLIIVFLLVIVVVEKQDMGIVQHQQLMLEGLPMEK